MRGTEGTDVESAGDMSHAYPASVTPMIPVVIRVHGSVVCERESSVCVRVVSERE